MLSQQKHLARRVVSIFCSIVPLLCESEGNRNVLVASSDQQEKSEDWLER